MFCLRTDFLRRNGYFAIYCEIFLFETGLIPVFSIFLTVFFLYKLAGKGSI